MRRPGRRAGARRRALPLLLALLSGAGAAIAAEADATSSASPFGTSARQVAASRLAEARGGFQAAFGLQLSFGIARSVLLDGAIVSTTTLVGSAAAADGGAVSVQIGTGAVLGAGSGAATLLQNTLDGRQLQLATVIDASVNSLALLRQSALQTSLRSAVIDALRR